MKRTILCLMVVTLMFVGCEYFRPATEFPMDPFDESASFTVHKGLVTNATLLANADPNFLDDKFIDSLMNNGTDAMVIETKVDVAIVTGEKGGVTETVAFAHIENYYDPVSTIELFMNKDIPTVDSLLSDKTYDRVVLTTDIGTSIAAAMDSVISRDDLEYVIEDEMSKAAFFVEATRCLYGKTGSIPVLKIGERSYNVTCAAVEVMSLYSLLEIAEDDIITFYFNQHMSMRIWDLEGNRIPMKDNSISPEMAAQFGNRADGESGRVVARCVYDLEPGTYVVRWIRSESTKTAAQFATNAESTTNYFRFRVGIFNSQYEEDPEIRDIVTKMESPAITKIARSAFQCNPVGDTLWTENELLNINDFVRSAEKSQAILSLDTITAADLDQGIFLSYDPSLPQGMVLLYLTPEDNVDTLKMYVDGGTFTFYKRTQVNANGTNRYAVFVPNLKGVTFREIFVSKDVIDDVHYFYNIEPVLYIFAFQLEEGSGINVLFKGN